MKINVTAQRLAWREMYRQRHCPNTNVLLSDTKEVQKHLRTCSYCRTVLEDFEKTEALGKLFANLPLPTPKKTPLKVGDVRMVQPDGQAQDWHDEDGLFFNPPLVLLINTDDKYFVQVAQVFTEPDLMSEGDINIGRGLLAQAWNAYALPRTNLCAIAYTHVSRTLAKRVEARSRKPFPYLDDNSILYQFRSDEIEVGCFFSAPHFGENQEDDTDNDSDI